MNLPYKPLTNAYTAQYGTGIQSIKLDGGSSRTRAGVSGNVHVVNVQWALFGEDYDIFMGFARNYERSGGALFEVDLVIDTLAKARYLAKLVAGSLQLTSKVGEVATVSGQLEVEPLPEFEDVETDYYGTLAMLMSEYGSLDEALEVFNLLDKIVNQDLPHA